MLDDHAVSYGRQTNGKYIILLLLLALASAFGAWAMEHKGEVQSALFRQLATAQEPMDWQDAPCNGASSVFGWEDGAVLLTEGVLYHLDQDGAITAQLDTGETEIWPLSGSLPGAWSESTLYLWREDALTQIPMETGILGAYANESRIAVISKGSGYLTCTKILDMTGQELGQIGLTDAAMTELVCTDEVLAGLCMEKSGQWSLRLYDLFGVPQNEIPLDEAYRCHLVGAEQGFLMLGEHIVRMYDQNGKETGRVTLREGTVSSGTMAGDTVAVLTDCGTSGILYFLSSSGSVLGKTTIPAPIRRVLAWEDRVYVLDYQALRGYDKQGGLLATVKDGARAADLGPSGSGLWLIGNGEISRQPIS